MLKIWHQVRKLEGYANCFSLLTPLHANPDIPPGLWAGLIHWSRRGMKVVRHLVQDGLILTCHEVKSKFAMSNNDLLTFLQVQNFIILSQKTSLVDSLFLLYSLCWWIICSLNSLPNGFIRYSATSRRTILTKLQASGNLTWVL